MQFLVELSPSSDSPIRYRVIPVLVALSALRQSMRAWKHIHGGAKLQVVTGAPN